MIKAQFNDWIYVSVWLRIDPLPFLARCRKFWITAYTITRSIFERRFHKVCSNMFEVWWDL